LWPARASIRTCANHVPVRIIPLGHMRLPQSSKRSVSSVSLFVRMTHELLREHDRVVLTAPIPAEGLLPGDVGTVVHVYASGAYEVEFFTLKGKTAAVVTLEPGQVRSVDASDTSR